MADPRDLESVLPIVSVLSAYTPALDETRAALVARFGTVLLTLGPLPFTETEYYFPTMGRPLERVLLAFGTPVTADFLPAAKLDSNGLERRLIGRAEFPVARPVNIDPGYLTPFKFVLASMRDRSHRLLLTDRVYGEVTLSFRDGNWQTWPWTYPDYASAPYQAFLREVRSRLLALRRLSPG